MGIIVAILVGVLIAAVLFGAALWVLNRMVASRRAALPSAAGPAAVESGAGANELLLRADDDMRDAEQEIGFVEAQFSAIEAKELRAALASARTELQAAFRLRQKLDDETPEDENTRQAWLREIAKRSTTAIELVEKSRSKVDALRDVERKAPELLASLPEDVAALEARLPAAEGAFTRLQGYAAAVSEPINGNIVEARKRVALARAHIDAGQQALTAGDGQAAGRAAEAAEAASAQAIALLDAVTSAEQALRDVEATVGESLVEARSTVAAARAAVEEGKVGGLAPRLAEAEERLKAADDFATDDRADPPAAARQTARAIAAANEVLAGVQQKVERDASDRQALDLAMKSAERTFQRSADYIRVRRNSVDAEARARLAEAERHLDLAKSLAAEDPARALDNARRAEGFASAAYNAARADFTMTKTAWGTEENLTAADLLGKFARGEFGRRRARR